MQAPQAMLAVFPDDIRGRRAVDNVIHTRSAKSAALPRSAWLRKGGAFFGLDFATAKRHEGVFYVADLVEVVVSPEGLLRLAFSHEGLLLRELLYFVQVYIGIKAYVYV